MTAPKWCIASLRRANRGRKGIHVQSNARSLVQRIDTTSKVKSLMEVAGRKDWEAVSGGVVDSEDLVAVAPCVKQGHTALDALKFQAKALRSHMHYLCAQYTVFNASCVICTMCDSPWHAAESPSNRTLFRKVSACHKDLNAQKAQLKLKAKMGPSVPVPDGVNL